MHLAGFIIRNYIYLERKVARDRPIADLFVTSSLNHYTIIPSYSLWLSLFHVIWKSKLIFLRRFK
jgi:hypothetical protein